MRVSCALNDDDTHLADEVVYADDDTRTHLADEVVHADAVLGHGAQVVVEGSLALVARRALVRLHDPVLQV